MHRRKTTAGHGPEAEENRPAVPSGTLQRPAGDFSGLGGPVFGGWVLDTASPDRKWAVEIVLDGVPLRVLHADLFVPELRDEYGTDGCHGFVVALDEPALASGRQVSAYVANSDLCLGSVALDGVAAAPSKAPVDIPGLVRWIGGLRLLGWAHDRLDPHRSPKVSVFEGADLLAEAVADEWYEPAPGEPVPPGRFGFDIALPAACADGRVHVIRVLDDRGVELAGSPLAMVTPGQGLERLGLDDLAHSAPDLAERIKHFERLLPASLPFDRYEDWRRAFSRPAPGRGSGRKVGVVLVGAAEACAATLAGLDDDGAEWIAVSVERDQEEGGWPEALQHLIEEKVAAGVIVAGGSRIHRGALEWLAAAIADESGPALVYADSEVNLPDGSRVPSFKPAFDRERFLAQGYLCDIVAFDPVLVPALSGQAPANIYAIVGEMIAVALRQGRRIAHMPEVLVTVAPRGSLGEAQALADALVPLIASGTETRLELSEGRLFPAIRIRPAVDRRTLVSVIIPTRDRLDLLEPCVASVLDRTDHRALELIVVDNDSREPDAVAYLQRLAARGHAVLPGPGPFNYARLNNLAARTAKGRFLLLLNSDTEVIDGGWLTALLEAGSAPDVGAVGAKLLWPSGIVQHGGVVLGSYFGAVHAFNDRHREDIGYDDLLAVSREVSAVTGACLLVRRENYLAVGGLDERVFPVNFNDVDFCLKLRALGRRNLWTPHATLLHKESASRGQDKNAERQGRARRELQALRLKWGNALVDDPFYSPNLNSDAYPYSGLAWPPRERALRSPEPPAPSGLFPWLL